MSTLKYDPLYYPYPSRRNAVYARNGVVATGQPLAAQAGLRILQKGGNAIDAAIATAACLTVVEPTANGIGGDAFALVWTNGKLHGLNASGPAPRSISIEKVKERGHDAMPARGVVSITVPGAPSAWAALSERFGRLPLTEVLEPAIQYAEHGYPLTPTLGAGWRGAFAAFRRLAAENPLFQPWLDTLPWRGCRHRRCGIPGHAALRSIRD